MKIRIATSVVSLAMFGFAQLAAAQVGLDDLTARETAWGDQLAASLHAEASQVRRPKHEVEGQTSGVQTWLRSPHGGTLAGITRLKFESPAAAQAYAVSVANVNHDVKHDTAIEVRGDQVVVVVGQTRPELVRKLAEAAWGGLPVSGPVDTALTKLRDGSVAFTTNVDGPARAEIADRLRIARAFKEATNSDIVTLTPDAAVARFQDGTQSMEQATPNSAALARATSAQGYEAMTQVLAALRDQHGHRPTDQTQATTATSEAAVGASKVIDGLLGR